MMRKYRLAFSFLLLLLYAAFAVALWLELTQQTLQLNAAHWVGIAGILAAATGWVVTSMVNLHNARRQHTVNVLLQSRLSQAYQQRLRDVVKAFPVTPKVTPIKAGDWDVAEMLDVKEASLRQMMSEQGIQYKLNKTWMPKQEYVNQGYFVVKAYVDPYGASFPNVYYTPKGVNWLAKRLNKWLVED